MALPIVNIGEWQRAHEADFGAVDGDIVIYTTYRAKLGILTPNITTPYINGFANLWRHACPSRKQRPRSGWDRDEGEARWARLHA